MDVALHPVDGKRQHSGRSKAQNGSLKLALRSSGHCKDAVDWLWDISAVHKRCGERQLLS